MLPFIRPMLAALTLSAAPLVSAAPLNAPSPYTALAATEARVAAIGFRLTTANAAWCPMRQPQFGWIWGDPRLYDADRRAEALAAYDADDESHAFLLHRLSEVSVFGKESVTRMYAVRAAFLDGVYDVLDAEVAFYRWRLANINCLIRLYHMQRVGVRLGIYRYGFNTKTPRG